MDRWRQRGLQLLIVLSLATVAEVVLADPIQFMTRRLVSPSTGLLETVNSLYSYRGSGVVTRNPRLIYTAAHMVFDDGRWATDSRFTRAYHGYSYPAPSRQVKPRGYRHFTRYANNASRYGDNSLAAFNLDFAIFYGYEPFGPAMRWWSDGGAALRSNRPKRLVGYPVVTDYTRRPGRYYQHATNRFNSPGTRLFSSLNELADVATGSGASGGLACVYHNGECCVAGVIVAGATRGVATTARALDANSNKLATNTLRRIQATSTFSNKRDLVLPDNGASYMGRYVGVSNMPGTVRRLLFSVRLTTTYRGDLQIYLRSPSGRIRWIANRWGGAKDDFNPSKVDYSSSFRGAAPNGTWGLLMRDAAPRNRAVFKEFSITIASSK